MKFILAILCYLLAGVASGASVSLAWYAPADTSQIVGYRIGYGTQSGVYSQSFDAGNSLTATISGLSDGTTYFFATQAYGNAPDSMYSNEVSARTPDGLPQASFSANPSSGVAPLSVSFSNLSTSATSYSWAFGDGGTSTATSPVYVYQSPGSFNAQLSATGPGGTSQAVSAITVTTAPPPSSTMGETNVLPEADSGNANLIVAQWATLSQSGTLQSISFYITVAAGQFRLGVYDDANGPANKRAETNSIAAVTGWNTVNVISPVVLPAGKYWIAYLASDNNLAFVKAQDGSSDARYYTVPYGPMPATFSASNVTASHFSLYATLSAAAPPPPPPPPPSDTTPPVVAIATPTDGAVLKGKGTVTISGSATDNVGVTQMSLLIDGVVRTTVNAASLSYTWNIRNVPVGAHAIAVTATDAAGNAATKTITVTRR